MYRFLVLALFLGTLAGCDAAGPETFTAADAATAASAAAASSIHVRGPVTAVGTDRLTVGGRVFVVTAQTRLLDRRNRPVPLSAFTVGTNVEAEGRLNADGTIRAKKVKMEDADEGASVEVRGPISAITETTVTVAGRTFTTNASTRYLDDRGRPVARTAFGVGTLVEAEGTQFASGVLVADKLKMDDH